MKLLIAITLLACLSLFATIQHMPVTMLVHNRLPDKIQVESIKGTLTQGTLQELQISPLPWTMQTAGWELQPASLFTLQPTFRVYGHSWNKSGNSSLSGNISYDTLTQLMTGSHVDMKLELGQLAVPFHLPVTGELVISLDSIVLNRSGCQSAKGAVTLSGFSSARLHWLAPLAPQVGSLSCEKNSLLIKLPLRDPQLNATIKLLLNPQGEYQLALDLWGMEQRLNQKVSNALGSEPDGVYNLNYQGELFF